MLVTLLGKRWKLRFLSLSRTQSEDDERILGLCDPPDKPGKEILIDNGLVDGELLEVLIHEMLHATDWQKSEEFITWQARDIAATLWKLGYRRNG